MVNLDRDKFEQNYSHLYNFKPNYLELGNNQLHYVDEGKGRPILMLHGNPTWSFYYRDLINHFSKTNRCIVPDHIGCGFSSKPQNYDYVLNNHIENIVTLIKKLDLKDITLVVHDWGGAIGFGVVTRLKDRFKNIVVLNTAAFRINYIPKRIGVLKSPVFGERSIRMFNVFAKAATFMTTKKKLDKDVKRAYLYPYNNYKNRIATARFVKDIPMDKEHKTWKTLEFIEHELPKIDIPKLFIWGKDDWCFNWRFLDRWKNFYPDSEYHELENTGHYVLEDSSDKVIELMSKFI